MALLSNATINGMLCQKILKQCKNYVISFAKTLSWNCKELWLQVSHVSLTLALLKKFWMHFALSPSSKKFRTLLVPMLSDVIHIYKLPITKLAPSIWPQKALIHACYGRISWKFTKENLFYFQCGPAAMLPNNRRNDLRFLRLYNHNKTSSKARDRIDKCRFGDQNHFYCLQRQYHSNRFSNRSYPRSQRRIYSKAGWSKSGCFSHFWAKLWSMRQQNPK